MHAPRCMIMRACTKSVVFLATVLLLLLGSAMRAEAVVHLVYFRATAGENDVLVEWETGSEDTTYGFNLYRTEQDIFVQPTHLNNGQRIDAKNFPGISGAEYEYVDGPLEIGLYFYWLEVLDGQRPEVFGPEEATIGPTPTPTQTSTPTVTPTATSTPTSMPTATSTPAPTATATVTPASVPSATPTSSLSATPTTAPPLPLSPTMTTSGTGEPPTTSVPTTGEVTPSPTPTSQVVGALTDQTESPERSSQPRATSWRPPGAGWPTIHLTTILLFISLISFLGVLLLSTALVLVRKSGL